MTQHASISASNLSRRRFLQSLLAAGSVLVVGPREGHAADRSHVEGVVFHDRNGTGLREGNPPIAGVRVSNGKDVAVTDENGRYRLPIEGERTIVFVIKPSGWRTPLSGQNLPRFYHINDEAGSPEGLRYPGLEPTGPLPESVDFPVYPQDESETFRVVMCGDPQPRNAREVGYLVQSAVPELARSDAAFGFSLGDIMFDNLDLFEPFNAGMGLIGKPWYNVLGNHDLNFDVPDNTHANETFLRIYGPTYYAFEYADVHFLVLNNIEWMGQDPERPNVTSRYRGYLGERQLAFVRNELAHVPKDKLTVILLHIPLYSGDAGERSQTVDRQALYRLIEDRPNLVSLSAHRHWHGHFFLGEDDGWRGDKPHHHLVMGTLCGSWFRGSPKADGIPHATMSDGTPRGYAVFEFSPGLYRMDGYKCIGRPAHDQMHIHMPNVVERDALADTAFHVNVYNGNEHTDVRMRLDRTGDWQAIEKVNEPDPRYVELFERDQGLESPYLPMSRPANCHHLWKGTLPENLTPGTHLLEIQARDMFGNTHQGARPIRIT